MSSGPYSRLQTDAVPIQPNHEFSKIPSFESELSEKSSPPSSPPPSDKEPINQTSSMINFTNCNNIHLGNALVFQAEKTVIHGKKYEEKDNFNKNEPQKDYSVLQLMDCNDEIPTKYLTFVSENLGKGWRIVFRNMGYKDGFIETAVESHKHEGTSEVIYQLLLDWIRNAEDGDQCTISKLSYILWNERKYELVQGLAALHQSMNSKVNSS